MDGRFVQWVRPIPNPHETCGLFEGFGTKTSHLAQRGAGFERTVRVAMRDDVGRKFGTDARDVREQRGAGGVDIHADAVDHAFDHAVEGVREGGLIDIVLIHADADGLGIDLDQLGERVLCAAGNGYRAADGDIEIGEFGAGEGGGGIDRCACFADDEVFGGLGRRLHVARTSSAASFSVSREAVPLPMVMSVTWWRLIISCKVLIAPFQSFFGSCG